MKRLKNILIIFICFLMLCSFTNDETAPLEYVQSIENIKKVSGTYTSAYTTVRDRSQFLDSNCPLLYYSDWYRPCCCSCR